MRRDSPAADANPVRVPAPRSSALPYAVLASAQVAVGAAAIFARFALGGAPPLAVAAWRLAIASAVLLVIAAFSRTSRERSPHIAERWIFIAAGAALAVHFATWIASLEYTSVAVSTLLVATTPIWTALYDSIACRRHLSLVAWGAFAIGAAGLLLVVGFNASRPPVPGHSFLGDALALAGAVAIGAYFILVREVRDSYGTRAIVTRTYSWAALLLLAACILARQGPPPVSDAKAWGGILAMALVSQLLGHTALNASLRWFSPSAVAMTTLLEPVSAALLALAVFGETLGGIALAGALLILSAIGLFLREDTARSTSGIGPVH